MKKPQFLFLILCLILSTNMTKLYAKVGPGVCSCALSYYLGNFQIYYEHHEYWTETDCCTNTYGNVISTYYYLGQQVNYGDIYMTGAPCCGRANPS